MNASPLPTVAIVGRPNVGKSTLFNALLGERKAIVSDIAGTTRDSVVARIDPREQFGPEGTLIPYLLVDTAGLTNTKGESLEEAVKTQVLMALEKADVILFTLDGKSLLTSEDEDLIQLLRKKSKKVILLINKVDDGNPAKVLEMRNIGFGEPLLVSGKNFFGIWDLQDELQEKFLEQGFQKPIPPEEPAEMVDSEESVAPKTAAPETEEVIRLAIVGRPNVGKSSLFNQLIGQERAVVSDVPGTTRDTLDEEIVDESGQKFVLVDSAGVRRPGKIGFQNLEYWSKVRTTQAIETADVCILLIDALEGITHQDLAVVNTILEAGKGLILGVNKFDLVREKTRGEETDERVLQEVEMWTEDLAKVKEDYVKYVRTKAGFLSWVSILFFSAKTGRGVKDILEKAKEVALSRKKRIDTSELNRFLLEIYHGHVAPSKGPKQGKMKYASQVDTCPPKFLFFVNNASLFHFSYKRYVENKIRAKYGFEGTPLHIEFRDERGK